ERLEQVARELSGAHVPAPPTSHATPPASGAQMSAALSDAARKAAQPLLLATKLTPPRVGATLVLRERLLHQLDGALAHRLTLLSAAAGWGKTILLATWLAERQKAKGKSQQRQDDSFLPFTFSLLPCDVAWLSLDALDNEQTRFWVAVIAALH